MSRVVLAIAGFAVLISGTVQGQGWSIPKPTPGLVPNTTAGKMLFAQHCSGCHGKDLKGSEKGPPLLHKIYESSHHGDAAFQLAVAKGVRAHHWQFGDMPPVEKVSPDDVAHITAHVREQQRSVGIR
ncbi:MAG: cytochrome c [Rhodocyclaceae bacterium]|nr:cytochrome c [Rhodocyclaceae bacterium]